MEFKITKNTIDNVNTFYKVLEFTNDHYIIRFANFGPPEDELHDLSKYSLECTEVMPFTYPKIVGRYPNIFISFEDIKPLQISRVDSIINGIKIAKKSVIELKKAIKMWEEQNNA